MTRCNLAYRPRHCLFRTTFVRGQADPQLTAIDEVVAVKLLAGDLARGLCRQLTAEERRLLLDDFFGRQESDCWLYLPLALVPHAGDRPILAPDHLTCLSDYLARPRQGAPGVLLATRSGAGKTVAGIKAFRDCVVQDAARLRAPLEHLRQWLSAGPLLLLLDLNSADNDAVRLAVARSLYRFQEDHAQFAHRCIVTSRSTEAHDAMTAPRQRDGGRDANLRLFRLVFRDFASSRAARRCSGGGPADDSA